MAGASGPFHEEPAVLSTELKDRHRAIVSIMEELEAIDGYDQRVEGAADPELKAILAHDRDEEKAHAMMTLEWLRRHDPRLDEIMRTYVFKGKPPLQSVTFRSLTPEAAVNLVAG